MGNFGHKIRWSYMLYRLRPVLEAFSEGQVKVRSQKIKKKKINIDKKVSLVLLLLGALMLSFIFSCDV